MLKPLIALRTRSGQRPVSSEAYDSGLQRSQVVSRHLPRAVPCAGMQDAFGVFAQVPTNKQSIPQVALAGIK